MTTLRRKNHMDRILILSQYYPPETGAPQNRLSDLAHRFKNAGYDVQVLTAKPNYPIGKIYQGFEKGFSQKTEQNGIPVTHCWIYSSNKTIFHRLVNYLSFVFSSIIIGLFKLSKFDLVIVESPPLFLSISGWVLSRVKEAKLVLNISDLYPETIISLGLIKNKLIIRVFYWLEKWSYKVSDLITGQTEGIVKSIHTRFPNKKVYLLTNGMGFDINDNRINSQVNNGGTLGDDFIIGYAGIIGYGQGLQKIFSSAKALQEANPQIKFHVYGDGPLKDKLEEQLQELLIKNIEFKGHRLHDEILKIMPTWDIGMVCLEDVMLMSGALPSKMFEIMANKLPVLLIAPKGEASIVVEEANAGLWVEPNSSDLITQAILELYENPELRIGLGRNAYECVQEKFNRETIFRDFLNYLQKEELIY